MRVRVVLCQTGVILIIFQHCLAPSSLSVECVVVNFMIMNQVLLVCLLIYSSHHIALLSLEIKGGIPWLPKNCRGSRKKSYEQGRASHFYKAEQKYEVMRRGQHTESLLMINS